jgi:hypothetical protein
VYAGHVLDTARGSAAPVRDLRQLPGLDIVVDGIDVGEARLEIDIGPAASALGPIVSSAFRVECAAVRPFRVLGDAGAELSIRARGGNFAFPTPLRAVPAAWPLVIPSRGITSVLVTAKPIGPLVVRREGVELDVPSRMGLAAEELQASPPRLRHGLVSLPRLAEIGYSRILVHPVGEAVHAVALDSLSHDELGAVHVDLPVEEPSWIECVLQGAAPPAGWHVFARPAERVIEGVTAEVADGRCVLGPITPGTWLLHWRRSYPLLFVPIATVPVPPGVRQQVPCSFRAPTKGSVCLLDWDETPPEDRPVAVALDARPCKANAGRPGSFDVEIVPEDRFGAELSMVLAGVGGRLTLPAHQWHGTELRVSLPRPEVVAVTVRPRFGGEVELWSYSLAPAADAPRFPLKRKLRAIAGGSHRFLKGHSHVVGACELMPDGSRVFLGFFAVTGESPASSIELPGRWVDVVGERDSDATMTAWVSGMEVEWHQGIPAGTSRFWLPESVDSLEVRTPGGLRRYARREVGAVLIL